MGDEYDVPRLRLPDTWLKWTMRVRWMKHDIVYKGTKPSVSKGIDEGADCLAHQACHLRAKSSQSSRKEEFVNYLHVSIAYLPKCFEYEVTW